MSKLSTQSLRSFVFIAIFLLCGQAIASPFLICRNMFATSGPETNMMSEDSKGLHCEGMLMDATEVSPDSTSMMMGDADEPSSKNPQPDFFKGMQDCAYFCQFCRNMNSFDATDSLVLVSTALLLRNSDSYLSRFVAPPVEVHFRPPINA